MEPDSGLDYVVEDLPGVGRSYQVTGTTAAASSSSAGAWTWVRSMFSS
jgi:hypothetical protein